MRWDVLLSLFSDERIKFLMWFIFAALIVATILTLIEAILKKKKGGHILKKSNESVIGRMKRFLKHDKTAREKLNFIDKTAKEYFKEVYRTHASSSYSVLIKEFEKNKRESEVAFCKAMLKTYSSHKELINNRVIALGGLLIDIDRKKKRAGKKYVSKIKKKQESKNKRLAKRRDKILRKQKKKEDLRINRLKVARINYAQKFHAEKDKEAVKKNKIQRVITKRKVRELIKQQMIQKKVDAKKKIIAAKKAKIQTKINTRENKIIITKKKKHLALEKKKKMAQAIAKKRGVIAKRREFRIKTEKEDKLRGILEIKRGKEKKALERIVAKKMERLKFDREKKLAVEISNKFLSDKKTEKSKKKSNKIINAENRRVEKSDAKRKRKLLKKQILETKRLEIINNKK